MNGVCRNCLQVLNAASERNRLQVENGELVEALKTVMSMYMSKCCVAQGRANDA